MNEQLLQILALYGIDCDAPAPNGQTALQFLEARVEGALDEIQEEQETADD